MSRSLAAGTGPANRESNTEITEDTQRCTEIINNSLCASRLCGLCPTGRLRTVPLGSQLFSIFKEDGQSLGTTPRMKIHRFRRLRGFLF